MAIRWLAVFFCVSAAACSDASPGEAARLECPAATLEVKRQVDTDGGGLERWCRAEDGRAQGPYRRELADGRVVAMGWFDRGLADGAWEWFDAEGQRVELVGFAAGRAHGRHAAFWGEVLRFERFWELGAPCGVWSAREAVDDELVVSERDFGACDDGEPPDLRPPDWAPRVVETAWTGQCPGRRVDVDEGEDGQGPEAWCEVEKNGVWVREGPYARWWDADKTSPREDGGYLAGERDGLWVGFAPGGELVSRGAWRAGARVGEHVAWYVGGAPRHRQRFVDGLEDGREEGFTDGGALAWETNWRAGLEDGGATVFGVRGLPLSRSTWAAGIETGLREHFFEDGALRESGQLVAGRREGPWETWHPNGRLAESWTYVADVAHGPVERFERDGSIAFRATATHGSLEGEASVWMWEGVLGRRVRESGRYEANQRHGLWTGVYDDTDQRWRELHYIRGEVWGTLRTWWPNGQLQVEVDLAWGAYQGLMSTWWDDGSPQSRCFWEDGTREGPCVRFWEGGAKKAEGEYRSGLKAPGWRYWDRDGNPLTTPPDGEHEGL